MHVRLALIATALALVACGGSKSSQTAARGPEQLRVAGPWVPQGTEFTVRMNESLGPGVTPAKELFTAQLVSPLITGTGVVVAPPGSLLHGHVVAVDPTQQRVELAFDRVQLPEGGDLPIQATVLSASPWALTVRAADQPEAAAKTAILQAKSPGAIGGGPGSAIDQEPQEGVVVPFGAQLKLMITQPIERPGR